MINPEKLGGEEAGIKAVDGVTAFGTAERTGVSGFNRIACKAP
jgi:hypothetical protein